MDPAYIAFEGAEGCGKSTHAKRLASHLGAVLTRETGGTEIGARLREILHDVSVEGLDPRSEALIAAADRAQHLAEVVTPALADGRHVVSDRSVFSTLAYQGYGRGLDLGELTSINEWAIRGRWPDLVLWLRIPPEEAATRLERRSLDRFERSPADFFERVEVGFTTLAADDPARWAVIDATQPKDDVETAIRAVVSERLGL